MRSRVAVVALVACLHALAWAIWQTQASAPNIEGVLNSVSYSPFHSSAHPDDARSRPTEAQVRADLKALAPYTNTIRLYSSTGGLELVPPIATEFGLKVTVGIWLDKLSNSDEKKLLGNEKLNCAEPDTRNMREICSGIELVRKNHNINGVVVGNETILTDAMKVDDLIKIIQKVKRDINGQVPVTTGDTWKSYEDHTELASAVDFIAAHVLPYWADVPAEGAADEAVRVYNELRRIFPGKRIVIAEFGWPRGGYNRQRSVPGKLEQASVVRSFISRAQALGIEYNIFEAFDQPWKTKEGSVGAYWGLYDANRDLKFTWTGPIVDGERWKISTIAVAVGVLVSLPILSMAGATMIQALLLAFAAHGIGAWTATLFEYWNVHYFIFGTAFSLALGMFLLIPLVVITLRRVGELAAVLFGRAPRRLLPPASAEAAREYAPKVSIHIPAYMEPPEMLKATLDAVARLKYSNFECIIVINNTPNPAMWTPVEEHCRSLGERFRFINAPRLDGYKAGALRLAMAQTAADAEIIGIIDSDYAVTADWLSDLVPAFVDPQVGLVQAPQDHRDGERSPLHHVMNGEYAGFFDVGMVERNEANAIIVHGTMCLIRRAALEAAGGWSSDTICEDTDLGLTILEQGWLAHYTNRRYGRGLLPDTFEAYKKQRDRWASGGFQIVKKHWRRFLPGESLLTRNQKREFAFGWVNWLGAESIGVLVAILNLIWVPIGTFAGIKWKSIPIADLDSLSAFLKSFKFAGIIVPDKVLTLPIIAIFAISVAHFIAVYRRRVPIPLGQAAAAMVAAMAMQWTVARAVANSIAKDHLTFVRTAKGGEGNVAKRIAFPAFNEAILGGLLVLGSLFVIQTNFERVQEINLFGYVLLVQSLPFLAAVALAAFENSRINDFVLWRALEAKVVERLPRELQPRRSGVTEATAAPEKRMEAAP
jgi:exo-beta-1,3-glucanase (GH17 family)/cellulose synthase/poly-beta-1,6-N-acetylglucosamine synthase-like glycosyltransferase